MPPAACSCPGAPAPFIGAHSPDRLLDCIERGNAFERFARDRRIAALGDVEEPAAQMRPAESKGDGLARRGSNLLVGGITVALHDAAIALEQLEPVDRTAGGSVAIGDGRRVSSTPRPVVPGNGPEVSPLGEDADGVEHRRYRLNERGLTRGQNVIVQMEITA